MEYNFNFNSYPSFNESQDNNIYENEKNNQNQNNKYFKIKETLNEFFIRNNKNNKSIKISKIYTSPKEYSNEVIGVYDVDSILGIFEVNDKKYLGVVTSSKVAAKLLNSFLFKITKIILIKMTNVNETSSDKKLREEIENIFSTENFYFSNEYDLSLSLYSQNIMNSYDYDGNNNNKKRLISKYLINSKHLKYFVENNIPECFYSTIIFGFIGCKIDINLDERKDEVIDIIIIERYYKKDIIINKDIPEYIKQIEFICNFYNKNNKKNSNNIFSFIFYVCSKSMNNINEFKPFNNFLNEELDSYKNITCIINNKNNINENTIIKEKIWYINQKFFNNKIKLIDFTCEWDQSLYFDTNNDSYNIINFYKNQSIDILQKNIILFIDINNYFSEDDICFNSFIRFMWKAIQKEINFLRLNIDIGLFDKRNNNYICNKFKEIIMKYHNDLDEHKKTLYNNIKRDDLQFKFNNYIINNSNNIDNKSKINNNIITNKNNNNIMQKNMTNNQQNYTKIKLMCITWNIAGIPCNVEYNITKLFTENIFYYKNEPPDIIVIGIQEIIKLSITSILSIVSNQENVINWTNNIMNTINLVFKNTDYFQLKCLDLVGIYLIVIVKKSLRKNISLLDYNITKTGVYGTLGNKGFFTLTLKCFDNLISFGSGHFEAGQSKNEDRIDTLIQLLNKNINYGNIGYTFKDIDFWIILGDLNFRIDLTFEDAIELIRQKKYDILYSLDQFCSSKENNEFLKAYIKEKEINFEPTYKYVKGSNEYAYDEDKIRVPAWTDRIFYCKNKNIKMLTYDTIKSIRYSDHRPVVGTFLINCVNKNNINVQIAQKEVYKNESVYIPKEVIKEIKENKINNIKNKKVNNQEIKMNYRGINFNTEIEITNHNNLNKEEKQNIYDFFQDKRIKNKTKSNLLFDSFY